MGRIKEGLKKIPGIKEAYRALRWQVHEARDLKSYFWPATIEEKIAPYGFRLGGPDSPANRAMILGCFDPTECMMLETAMAWGETFIDVGANIGLYSCVAKSKGLGVIAIEPQPGNLRHLMRNLELNGYMDVELWPVGVAEESGLRILYGASGPSASLVKGWAGYSTRFKQTIPVTTLDILLGQRLKSKRILIKIDVEGAEFGVLLGAEETMKRKPYPIWFVEICLSKYHPGGINLNFEQTFNKFWEQGYSALALCNPLRRVDPVVLERWIREGRTDNEVINFVFCDPTDGNIPIPFAEQLA